MSRELRDWEKPYEVDHHCETCNTTRRGTEYPMAGFHVVCHYCANPPVLVALWRHAKRVVRNRYNRIKYLLTTSKEERAKQAAHREAVKARINARRAEAGEPLIGERKVEYVTFLGIIRKWRNA